ncbi:hypothetical protein ACFPT7_01560 [Acidicapsa dinghuensis]|uniref:Uncharacterized protein n=1 Tax=Acidicapsa dinghuensis TaxID=2218256 RepID=A0ABW1EAA3_9BACT|nr:hypothetical protein [Acidicapsa dinghuensis]
MKYLFLLTILVLVGVTLYADYLWKRWLRSRQAEHDRDRRA